MNGGDVRARREALGLSRPQLVDRLQNASISRLTVGRLAGIECRKDEIPASEVPAYRAALGLSADESEADEPEDELVVGNGTKVYGKRPSWAPPDAEVLFEWNGLRVGSLFKVEGEPRATFEFRMYYRDSHQEYVECWGGKRSHEKRRWFRPERLRTLRGRRICGS